MTAIRNIESADLWNSSKYVVWIVGIVFLASVSVNAIKDTGEANLHILQAEAFLQGKLDIDRMGNDVAVYNNKYYVTFPPFPSVLLTPFVWIFGTVNTTLVALLLTAVLIWVMNSVFFRLGLTQTEAFWLIIAVVFGTGYWFVTKFSFGVWYFSHVVAVLMIFLGLREMLGKGRGWLVAIFLGCAFLTRQLALYSCFFVVALMIDQAGGLNRRFFGNLAGFCIVFALFASSYLILNYLRFDDPFNTGYYYIAGGLSEMLGEQKYGLFHYNYIPYNFIHMFIQGPHVEFDGVVPTNMDYYGTSITFASPFVFLAFRAQASKLFIAGAAMTIGVSLGHMMLYCNNGWVQINTQRFFLDFLPVLILLVGLSLKHVNRKLVIGLILFAVALNIFAFTIIPFLELLMKG